MKLRSTVVISLHSPKEKVWGLLLDLTPAGATVQGLELHSFEIWLNQFGSPDQPNLTTVFYPLYRIERIALDEREGAIPSLEERFRQRAGIRLRELLSENHEHDV
jgi:hypothetical protein